MFPVSYYSYAWNGPVIRPYTGEVERTTAAFVDELVKLGISDRLIDRVAYRTGRRLSDKAYDRRVAQLANRAAHRVAAVRVDPSRPALAVIDRMGAEMMARRMANMMGEGNMDRADAIRRGRKGLKRLGLAGLGIGGLAYAIKRKRKDS